MSVNIEVEKTGKGYRVYKVVSKDTNTVYAGQREYIGNYKTLVAAKQGIEDLFGQYISQGVMTVEVY